MKKEPVKNKRVEILLEPAFYEELKEFCTKRGLKISPYIRNILFYQLKGL